MPVSLLLTRPPLAWTLLLLLPLVTGTHGAFCQSLTPQESQRLVAAAEKVELESDRTDHSAYIYRSHDVTPDHDTVSLVVETPQGTLRLKVQDHGSPLNPSERRAEEQRIQNFIGDRAAQAKARKDAAHDDEQAEQMLKLLPTAFLWTFVRQEGDLTTLAFRPDPNFQPQSIEARVLSAMGGQVVINRAQNRIHTIRGSLLADVKIGYGILGRLKQGGTFEVERREVAPHHWQMISSRVHIEGHALLFKTIGEQDDETHADFKPSPYQTVEQAWKYLQQQTQ